MEAFVVAAATTGSGTRKKDNPAAGTGAKQARVMEWALARGAQGVRTGLENRIRSPRERLAASHAALVRMAAKAAARRMPGLSPQA